MPRSRHCHCTPVLPPHSLSGSATYTHTQESRIAPFRSTLGGGERAKKFSLLLRLSPFMAPFIHLCSIPSLAGPNPIQCPNANAARSKYYLEEGSITAHQKLHHWLASWIGLVPEFPKHVPPRQWAPLQLRVTSAPTFKYRYMNQTATLNRS